MSAQFTTKPGRSVNKPGPSKTPKQPAIPPLSSTPLGGKMKKICGMFSEIYDPILSGLGEACKQNPMFYETTGKFVQLQKAMIDLANSIQECELKPPVVSAFKEVASKSSSDPEDAAASSSSTNSNFASAASAPSSQASSKSKSASAASAPSHQASANYKSASSPQASANSKNIRQISISNKPHSGQGIPCGSFEPIDGYQIYSIPSSRGYISVVYAPEGFMDTPPKTTDIGPSDMFNGESDKHNQHIYTIASSAKFPPTFSEKDGVINVFVGAKCPGFVSDGIKACIETINSAQAGLSKLFRAENEARFYARKNYKKPGSFSVIPNTWNLYVGEFINGKMLFHCVAQNLRRNQINFGDQDQETTFTIGNSTFHPFVHVSVASDVFINHPVKHFKIQEISDSDLEETEMVQDISDSDLEETEMTQEEKWRLTPSGIEGDENADW